MGVSKNSGTVVPQKWMVYNGKPYELTDDLGGFHPPFKETIGNSHIGNQLVGIGAHSFGRSWPRDLQQASWMLSPQKGLDFLPENTHGFLEDVSGIRSAGIKG